MKYSVHDTIMKYGYRFVIIYVELFTSIRLASVFTPFEITLQRSVEHLLQPCERFVRYLCDRSDFQSCMLSPEADYPGKEPLTVMDHNAATQQSQPFLLSNLCQVIRPHS